MAADDELVVCTDVASNNLDVAVSTAGDGHARLTGGGNSAGGADVEAVHLALVAFAAAIGDAGILRVKKFISLRAGIAISELRLFY